MSEQLDIFAAAKKSAARKRARARCTPPVRVDSYDRRGRRVSGHNRRCPFGRALRQDEK